MVNIKENIARKIGFLCCLGSWKKKAKKENGEVIELRTSETTNSIQNQQKTVKESQQPDKLREEDFVTKAKQMEMSSNSNKSQLIVTSREEVTSETVVASQEKLSKAGKNMVNVQEWDVQEWVDKNFPKEKRAEVIKLDISRKDLEGDLELSNFINLKELNFWWNKLTSLDLSNCFQLEEIICSYNNLTNLDLSNCPHIADLRCSHIFLVNLTLPSNPIKLWRLDLRNNNFSAEKDLSFLAYAVNLEYLRLGNDDGWRAKQGIYNRFTGSLDYLSNMKFLKYLDIKNTDLNEVNVNKLPSSLEVITFSTELRPDCKLTTIIPRLKEYNERGWCSKCQKPNTSKNWCQFCKENEWKEDKTHLTGRELIDKFINWQKSINKENQLQWIPYKQFEIERDKQGNIKVLAEGGFSKIYKAKILAQWKNENFKEVVLKVLKDSKDISLSFLTEIANNKSVDSANNVVTCCGISQDLNKDYIMVMEYMKEGNLRDFLKSNASKLSWEGKIYKLYSIANGLKYIHEQGLIHRDFHSGNILNDSGVGYVTDLGLSQPADLQNQKQNGIYGVLPYIAPEVLRGQPYTQASDIYSFGMVVYELLVNTYPYYEYYEKNLSEREFKLKVWLGFRPQFPVKIPPLLEDLVKKCWDGDPLKRPVIGELHESLSGWLYEIANRKDTEFTRQVQAMEDHNQVLSRETRYPQYKIHPSTIYTSRLVNTREIVELLQNPENHKWILEQEIKKLEQEINQSLTDEQKKMVSDFIQARKEMTKDESNKEVKAKALELEDQLLDRKDLPQKKIDIIIEYCDRFVEEQKQLQTQIEVPTNKYHG